MESKSCACRAISRSPKGPKKGLFVRNGSYFRKSDGKRIQRFLCVRCRRSFSQASFSPAFGQKKRHLNSKIFNLLCSGVSMRRTARLLGINEKTVPGKLTFLAQLEGKRNRALLSEITSANPVREVQFDEMESSVHSKLKPVSIVLAVTRERYILGIDVASMPAKGILAALSRKKYGPRVDERPKVLRSVLEGIRPYLAANAHWKSDQCPRYPGAVRDLYPGASHEQFEGKRGCIVGQGELKKVVFDPLFSLNHTAAMFRANVNRLFRRTWCTSKKVSSLLNHLILYASYHNRQLALS